MSRDPLTNLEGLEEHGILEEVFLCLEVAHLEFEPYLLSVTAM